MQKHKHCFEKEKYYLYFGGSISGDENTWLQIRILQLGAVKETNLLSRILQILSADLSEVLKIESQRGKPMDTSHLVGLEQLCASTTSPQ